MPRAFASSIAHPGHPASLSLRPGSSRSNRGLAYEPSGMPSLRSPRIVESQIGIEAGRPSLRQRRQHGHALRALEESVPVVARYRPANRPPSISSIHGPRGLSARPSPGTFGYLPATRCWE
jgi:hypothetical protein